MSGATLNTLTLHILHFESGPFWNNLNDDELPSISLAVTWTLQNHLFNMNTGIYLEAFSFTPLAGAARPAVGASLSGPEEVDIFPSVLCSPAQVILYTISGGRQADLGHVPQQRHL